VRRCAISLADSRRQNCALTAATSWRPTEMAHRNCNADVGRDVATNSTPPTRCLFRKGLLIFGHLLFDGCLHDAQTTLPFSLVGERPSASMRAGTRSSEIAPNAPKPAAIMRRSVTSARNSATLLGSLVVTCHDTASWAWSKRIRLPSCGTAVARPCSGPVFFQKRTSWLGGGQRRHHAPRLVRDSRPGFIQPIDSGFSFLQ
jgi:hypothetical protein